MQHYIVTFELKDKAVNPVANFLYKSLQNVALADVFQVEDWSDAENGCTLWIIAHGNGKRMNKTSNPKDLLSDNPKLDQVYKKASTVVLVSCSTADESNIVFDNGFQASTFAKNLKNNDQSKKIIAAVGPVYGTKDGISVKIPFNAQGFASHNGWVAY